MQIYLEILHHNINFTLFRVQHHSTHILNVKLSSNSFGMKILTKFSGTISTKHQTHKNNRMNWNFWEEQTNKFIFSPFFLLSLLSAPVCECGISMQIPQNFSCHRNRQQLRLHIFSQLQNHVESNIMERIIMKAKQRIILDKINFNVANSIRIWHWIMKVSFEYYFQSEHQKIQDVKIILVSHHHRDCPESLKSWKVSEMKKMRKTLRWIIMTFVHKDSIFPLKETQNFPFSSFLHSSSHFVTQRS